MATLYPESILEDLVAAYLEATRVEGGALAEAGDVLKGFGALEFSLPALVAGVGESEDDPTTGNFHCALTLSVFSHPEEAGVRAVHTAREAELRDICRAAEIEVALNTLAEASGLSLRVQWWEPKALTRSAPDGQFMSAQRIEVEVYFV